MKILSSCVLAPFTTLVKKCLSQGQCSLCRHKKKLLYDQFSSLRGCYILTVYSGMGIGPKLEIPRLKP